MNYAIIAAGNGSRLAHEGVSQPKPLVRVHGENLIERLFRIFSDNDAENIFVICNEEMTDVADFIRNYARCKARISEPQDIENGSQMFDKQLQPEIHLLVKSTPSSMHSLYELSKIMRSKMTSDRFILTTVDTIFSEKEFADYVALLRDESEADGIMGLTTFIDDEKPLYVALSSDPSSVVSTANEPERITGYFDTQSGCTHISAGIYGLSRRSFSILGRCIESGQSRMRNLQRSLISSGLLLRPYVFGKVLDIDHASDIVKAEEFLARI